MLEYVRRLLSAHYEVAAVPDGEEAWAAIVDQRPDLVLTDVMMPKLDGFGLLARIRDDAKTRSLPVILLSARAGEESRVEGLEAGADDYLIKPFSARELVARVRANLEIHRLRQESVRSKNASRAKSAWRRFYESGLVGVIYWNMDGAIVDANDKFLEMVGYTRQDLAAGRIDSAKAITPPSTAS